MDDLEGRERHSSERERRGEDRDDLKLAPLWLLLALSPVFEDRDELGRLPLPLVKLNVSSLLPPFLALDLSRSALVRSGEERDDMKLVLLPLLFTLPSDPLPLDLVRREPERLPLILLARASSSLPLPLRGEERDDLKLLTLPLPSSSHFLPGVLLLLALFDPLRKAASGPLLSPFFSFFSFPFNPSSGSDLALPILRPLTADWSSSLASTE